MDATNNRAKKNGRPQGHEWEDSSFDWDNMKDGIFQKIQKEDPQFFEEKRRRVAAWWWAGAAMLLLAGFAFWLNNEEEKTGQQEMPDIVAENKPTKVETPLLEKSITQKQENYTSNESKISENENLISNNNPTVNFHEIKNTISKKENKNQPAIISKNKTDEKSKKSYVQKKQKENISLKRNEIKLISPLSDKPLKPIDFKTATLTVIPKFVLDENKINDPKNDREKGQWKIIASSGPLISFSKYSGNSDAVALRNDHTSPYFGFQYGIEAWLPVSKKNYLTFGLNRQTIYQNIDIYTQRSIDTLVQNTLLKSIHYVVGDRTSSTYGDTLVTAVQRNRLVKYNEFKFVQAQVSYARIFTHKKWNFAPFVGVTVGLLTDSDGMTVAADKSIFAFNDVQPIFNRYQFNTQAGTSIERQLAGKVSIQFQYRIGKQWNNLSKEQGMELRPAFHYFSIGVSKTL